MAFSNEPESDLIKARAHKYVKRTGSPGHYVYWYKLPDGSIVAGDDSQQKEGRKQHAIRLAIARAKGKHAMTNAQIIEHTGYHKDAEGADETAKRAKAGHNLRGHIHGVKKTGKKKITDRGETVRDDNHAIEHGHDFEDHHLDNEHHDGEAEATEAPAAAPSTPAAPARRARSPRAARTPRTEESAPEAATAPAATEEPAVDNAQAAEIAKLRAQLAAAGINLGGSTEAEAPTSEATPEAATEAPATDSSGRTPEQREAYLAEAAAPAPRARRPRTPRAATPPPVPAEAAAPAPLDRATIKAAAARAKALARAIGPDAPAARVMASTDPTFAADEAPIREAIAAQAAGKNPYLERAKEIFSRISSHIPEKNRLSFGHFLETLGDGSWTTGSPLAEAEVKGAYEAGRTPDMLTWAALKTAMPTYKGLYHDMGEILGNAPINPEVERMKRGYGRKQFERMRPYVKDSWHLANRDAPPPYPTFGDLKSWNDFGSRPDWASPRAQLAVPKEVHDASPKDANGKVQLPPKWMQIHLQPLWNYACHTNADYQSQPRPNEVTGSSLNLNMSADLGGHILNAMRKYVQARGGANQLIDIPAAKMPAGLSHSDIFKGFVDHDLTDKTLHKIMAAKIIDPVAMAPFVEAELKPKEIKKSWSLVVDVEKIRTQVEEALSKSEAVSKKDLLKSELIKAIKAKKYNLGRLGIRG